MVVCLRNKTYWFFAGLRKFGNVNAVRFDEAPRWVVNLRVSTHVTSRSRSAISAYFDRCKHRWPRFCLNPVCDNTVQLAAAEEDTKGRPKGNILFHY